MIDTTTHWFFSAGTLRLESLTDELREFAYELMADSAAGQPGILVATASEILNQGEENFPDWIGGRETVYLIILDVPIPAAMRLAPVLGLRKPDQRMHLTADPKAVRRLIIAQARSEAIEGIVDAYLLMSTLVLILGDLSLREVPTEEVSVLKEVREVANFRIDIDGSFLEWPEHDLHLDAGGLLKEIDPEYQVKLEIERLMTDFTGEALAQMRESAGLRQTDIDGLSARHIRRIEHGVSSLTLDAARTFARAFNLELEDFLNRLARQVSKQRQAAEADRNRVTTAA